jgi:hypothetical protein
MKIRNVIVGCIGSIIALSSCGKSCEKTNSGCKLVPAKVLRYDCDRVILQILSTTLIGDASWTDVQTGQRYSNVVSYYNNCKLNSFTNGQKVTLYVELNVTNAGLVNPDCIQCQAVSQDPPQTNVDFVQISKTPCSTVK